MTQVLKAESSSELFYSSKYPFCKTLYRLIPKEVAEKLSSQDSIQESVKKIYGQFPKQDWPTSNPHCPYEMSVFVELIKDPDSAIDFFKQDSERGFSYMFFALANFGCYKQLLARRQMRDRVKKVEEQIKLEASQKKQRLVCKKATKLVISCAVAVTIYFLELKFRVKDKLRNYLNGHNGPTRSCPYTTREDVAHIMLQSFPEIIKQDFWDKGIYRSRERIRSYFSKIFTDDRAHGISDFYFNPEEEFAYFFKNPVVMLNHLSSDWTKLDGYAQKRELEHQVKKIQESKLVLQERFKGKKWILPESAFSLVSEFVLNLLGTLFGGNEK